HDETGQRLTSVTLGLKSVEERIEEPELRAAVAALGQQVAVTMQEVRRIALELRPKVLDDYGLVSALERLATTFSSETGIPVDLAVVREGLRLVLEKHDDLEAVGEAGTVDQALEQAERLRPDLVLLDLALPGKPGLQALPGLLRADPDVKVLILSMEDDPRYV